MKTIEITKELAINFKISYSYKMGGTQTIIMPTGEKFYFDDREYYSGRGSKYNSSIRHDIVGDVYVTKNQLYEYVKKEKARNKMILAAKKESLLKLKRINKALKQGVYNIVNGFVELSDDECEGKYFDVNRLARTLDITESDAALLKSQGKTYVFAKSCSGIVYELYHSSLDCNKLVIDISIPSAERLKEFNHDEWCSAPYAGLVGQTENINHFVC